MYNNRIRRCIYMVICIDHTTHYDNTDSYKISIVGKPNVGKSSIFNRIVCDSVSIVHKDAGVTRDRVQEYGMLGFTLQVTIYNHPFYIEDTPGIDFENKKSILNIDMIDIVEDGINQSDLSSSCLLSQFSLSLTARVELRKMTTKLPNG